MKLDPNVPAFPTDAFIDKGQPGFPTKGLTKREYFIIEFAKGLLTQHLSLECESGSRDLEPTYLTDAEGEKMVSRAFRLADLLIARLNQEEPKS